MTTAITPVNAWGASLSIPSDLEPANSASLALFVQEIANRLEYLRGKVPGASPTGSPIERFPDIASGTNDSTDWSLSSYGSSGGLQIMNAVWFQGAIAQPASGVSIPLDSLLQTGNVIKSMSVDFCGRNTHGALPATMPLLALYKIPRGLSGYAGYFSPGGSIVFTQVDSQVDTSGTTGAYETVHAISKTLAAPETVDLTNFSYCLNVRGEYGANAVANAFFKRPTVAIYGV